MNVCKSLILVSIAFAAFAGTQAHADFKCTKPFQRSGTIALPVGYSGSSASVHVPFGYRLKLSYVSVLVTFSPRSRAAFEVGSYAGGHYAAHPLPVLLGYNENDRQASHAIEIYADPASMLVVCAYRGNGTSTAIEAPYAVRVPHSDQLSRKRQTFARGTLTSTARMDVVRPGLRRPSPVRRGKAIPLPGNGS